MADFDPPFGESSERRLPTTSERNNGFPCGPADQQLFNGMFNRIEAEIGEVISFAGLAPTDERFTQLREAIEALIAAATGAGDTSQFLLVSQAQARLPIFPDVSTVDGRIVVTAPSTGTVRVPAGVTFLHRGVFPVTTAQTDFATSVSKTYHLRWNPTDGFTLEDLAGGGSYNPGSLAEINEAFDSTYDDMLVARIVTNSSNVATITNLANKALLKSEGDSAPISPSNFDDNVGPGALTGPDGETFALNWARKPQAYLAGFSDVQAQSGSGSGELNIAAQSLSRYQVRVIYERSSKANTGFVAYVARA